MSNLYIRKNENTKAENILISGLNQPGDVIWVWAELIKFYINTHHPEKAEEYLVKAEKKFPHNPMLTDLKIEYLKSRNLPFADIKIYSVKNFFDYPITQRNYLAYADILKRYPLKNVIMQYPLRETGPLKKLLSGYEGIVFVDNSIVFTEALKIHTYDELFLDRFGEDFGHFTQISSDMIADNIILTLKKENFLPH